MLKHRRVALWTLLLSLACIASLRVPGAAAFPEPAVVSPSWNLDFQAQAPRPTAYTDIDGNTSWYWYLPYKVTNRTGADQLFIPEVIIYTDTGQILRAGQNVPSGLYPIIERHLNNPLLESPIEVVGKILQGDDYARESVAIWPAFEGDVDQFIVFFGGLSGETQTVHNPLTGEPVLVRRTRMLTYRTPGNYPTPQNQPVIFEGEQEVMR